MPYVGAAAVQAAGVTGKGVRVAVLDSGVDYTHRNLGGPGTVAAYQKAIASATSRSGVFDPSPTAKVYEGYDFVGEHWDGDKVRTLEPDDNPIDADGHGTHVADIIARQEQGWNTCRGRAGRIAARGEGLQRSSARPAAASRSSKASTTRSIRTATSRWTTRSTSSTSPSPRSYGQKEDSTAVAASNAAKAGVIVVTVAGNSGDKPYDLGSPGISPDVITVAQTQVPSATAISLVIKSAGEHRGHVI